MPDSDEIIENCIDAIWDKYDVDQSGYLDKEECFIFMLESVSGFLQLDDEYYGAYGPPKDEEEAREFWKY